MSDEGWKAIVTSSLDGEQGPLNLDNAVKDLPANLRGRRPEGLPQSPWELVEHIRIAQHDLLDFCRNPDYHHDLNWPDDYWPQALRTILVALDHASYHTGELVALRRLLGAWPDA